MLIFGCIAGYLGIALAVHYARVALYRRGIWVCDSTIFSARDLRQVHPIICVLWPFYLVSLAVWWSVLKWTVGAICDGSVDLEDAAVKSPQALQQRREEAEYRRSLKERGIADLPLPGEAE